MRVVLLPGSIRTDSVNVRLLKVVADKLSAAGLDTDFIRGEDLTAPLFNGDIEANQGIPDAIKALNARMAEADALVVSSPEYNGFFSPLFKNTLDWMSRSSDGQSGTAIFQDKAALVLAASPGAMAAARALPHIRTQLSNLGMNVYRAQLGLGRAGAILGADGQVLDEATEARLTEITTGFAQFVKKLTHE